MRAGLRSMNVWLRLSRCGFRTYVHPVAAIVGAAETHGLRLERREQHGLLWESAAFAALAQDARVPERVAARLRPHAEPVRARADGDLREQPAVRAC